MARGLFMFVAIGAQLAILIFVVVVAVRMMRAQERIAAAVERLANRRDPGMGPGPTVAGS